MVRVTCEHCRAGFAVPEDLVGKRVRCAKCGSAFRLTPAGDASAGGLSIFDDENWLDGSPGKGSKPGGNSS